MKTTAKTLPKIDQIMALPRKVRFGHTNQSAQYHLHFVFAKTSKKSSQLNLPTELSSKLSESIKYSSFCGEHKEILHLPSQNIIVIGLGATKNWRLDKLCEAVMAGSTIYQKIKNCALCVHLNDALIQKIQQVSQQTLMNKNSNHLSLDKENLQNSNTAQTTTIKLVDIVTHIALSIELAIDAIDILKTSTQQEQEKNNQPLELIFHCNDLLKSQQLNALLQRANDLGDCIRQARLLAATPSNILTPQSYVEYLKFLVKQNQGLKLEILAVDQLRKLGMHGVLSVGQGSTNPPYVAILRYQPQKTKTNRRLVFVGKGITFDTGGISIKPSQRMHEMKYDMCGSALAVQSIILASKRNLAVPVYTIVGLAENMPSDRATKPGDVYRSYKGLTVENQNTDAEGRLVLADILTYACEQNPDAICMIDFATLTGACIVALGHEAAGLMTEHEGLALRLQNASEHSLDRLWRLPHWDVYDRGLKSNISDVRNISDKGAGTVTAMRFLSKFVSANIAWAHIDIAGVAWHDDQIGSQTKGPTGWGLRLILEFMEEISK